MKTNFILKCFTHILFLFLIKFSFGQGTKIIAFQTDNCQGKIVSYDYSSHIYDTLYSIPGSSYWFDEESSIDVFNGRYFFGANITGYPSYMIFSYNIYSQVLTPLFQMQTGMFDQGIEYDCFTNSLIYRENDSLKSFNISSGIKSTICKIICRDCNDVYVAFLRAYNYYNQQYLYIDDLTGNNDYYFILADVLNRTMIDTVLIPSGDLLHFLTYDITTNSYYGVTNNGSISRIDSMAENYTNICAPPPNYNGSLNEQDAVFDSYHRLYLQPFWNTNNQNKLEIADVSNSTIIDIDSFPQLSNYQRLNSMPKPIIKFQDSSIIASYANSYNWYFNDNSILGANSQTYTPTATGYYKVKETFLDGRKAFSDSTYVNPLAIGNNTLSQVNNLFHPNPFSESTTLTLNKNYSNIELTIYNIMGQEVKNIRNISGIEVKLKRENLTDGIYFYKLKQDLKNISVGKLIIMD